MFEITWADEVASEDIEFDGLFVLAKREGDDGGECLKARYCCRDLARIQERNEAVKMHTEAPQYSTT